MKCIHCNLECGVKYLIQIHQNIAEKIKRED